MVSEYAANMSEYTAVVAVCGRIVSEYEVCSFWIPRVYSS